MSTARGAVRRSGPELLLLGALLAGAAARFRDFLAGGVFAFRDAGSFFLPLREVLARLLRAGEFPAWNEWLSHGRALAADPNGAVFWPLSPLHAWVSPSGVVLVHVALALALFFAALRLWGLPAAAAAAGGATLLFSGVFQTLPVLFTTLASALPLPLFVVLLSGAGEKGKGLRRSVLAGLLLGVSLLGGEPVVAAIGALAGGLVVAAGTFGDLLRRDAATLRRRAGLALLAALLAAGTAGVQLLPTLAELPGSARGRFLRAEDGALFWSVPPARLLTLVEPRLTGDPFAEEESNFWGAATFDAGNPYFYDLSIGLLPLALALSSAGGRKGRSALLLAAAGALVATGRYLPGFAALAAHAPFLRYPEKGWILATFALAAAAACGVADLASGETRALALRRLGRVSLALAGLLGLLALLAAAAPAALRALVWGLGLGAGPAPAGAVAALLLPLLASGAASALLLSLVSRAFAAGRLPGGSGPAALRAVVAAALFVFLVDGARRVAGTCPATPPAAFEAAARSEEARAVVGAIGEGAGGRFYDDGADDRGVAVARARERDGLDLLRPATGVLLGVRYAGENDIDRMTPAASFDWVRLLTRLPWGEEKVARLRAAGVAVARTRAPLAGVAGTRTIARAGQDRIVRIDGARPPFELAAEGRLVPPGASLPFSPEVPVVEAPGVRPGPAIFSPGVVTPVVVRSSFQRLRLSPEPGERLLLVGRSFDPSWRARADGREVRLLRADGFLSALLLPGGTREVTLSYENGRIRDGALATAASLLFAGLALVFAGLRKGAA